MYRVSAFGFTKHVNINRARANRPRLNVNPT